MWIAFLFLIVLIIAYWYTYPKCGFWIYGIQNQLAKMMGGLKPKTINIDGVIHHVMCSNDDSKPLLLLIHGFSADHNVWSVFASHFTRDYFVVIPDLAGHGNTGFDVHWDFTIKAQANRMSCLIGYLGHKKAHIVGNSMGGFIAAQMALDFPEQCKSISLIDPAGVKSPKPSPMVKMLQQGKNPFDVKNDLEFEQFYNMVMARPPFTPKVVKHALSKVYQYRAGRLMTIFSQYSKPADLLDERIPEIDTPMCLIWGAKDQLIDVSSVNVWAQAKYVITHIWWDLGHMPMVEAPKRTAYAIEHFIRKH